MSEKFNAIVIDNQNEKFTREIKEIDKSQLKDGNVLVKVDYSSLNYKDSLILNDGGKIVRKFPFVPGIDFSGTVIESEDNKFSKGDKVILTGFRVGEAYFGGFSQYAKVESNFLIKIPKLYYTKSHFPLEISQRAFDHLWRVCESYEMWCRESKQENLISLNITE